MPSGAGFARAAEAIAIDTAIAAELLEILNRSNVETRAQRRRDAERFRRELAALELKEDQLTELLLAGTLDEPAFKKQLQRIREERSDLCSEVGASQRAPPRRAHGDRTIHFRTRETSPIAVG